MIVDGALVGKAVRRIQKQPKHFGQVKEFYFAGNAQPEFVIACGNKVLIEISEAVVQ